MDWTPALAPEKMAMVAAGCVGCPSPAPGTHGRVPSAPPGFCVERYEDTALLLGRRGYPPCGSAIITSVLMAPQYVCGAATWGGTRIQNSRQDTRPTADCAGVHTAEKHAKKPLSGAVCLLTRRGLIRVRRGMRYHAASSYVPLHAVLSSGSIIPGTVPALVRAAPGVINSHR
jgi:hypothetical protein